MAEVLTEATTSLLERYEDVRCLTESLAAPLGPEDQTVQSMPDVSPTKWHRAHTTWFFETFVLGEHGAAYQQYHPAFAFLFNSYYVGVGDRHARDQRGLLSRPGVDDITSYRAYVDEAMVALLDATDDLPCRGLVELGLHHEQQHQELLLMDIKHVLSRNPLEPSYLLCPPGPGPVGRAWAGSAAPLTWTAHPGGLAEIGHDGCGFAYDNESPRHRVVLTPFALADRPVTCGEWLAFVEDGGYQQPELWLSDGWADVQSQQLTCPLYWSRADGEWRVFTLGGTRPLQLDEPVCHVSYYEADAFAHWSGARLPTEAEWEVMATVHGAGGSFLDQRVLHPRPVAPAQEAPVGLCGDVWQWTSSAYSPYPGFRPAAGAVGEYNGKFMANQYVLRGGSCVTPPGHTRTTYRNFFPPAARWAFSGVRLAKDA